MSNFHIFHVLVSISFEIFIITEGDKLCPAQKLLFLLSHTHVLSFPPAAIFDRGMQTNHALTQIFPTKCRSATFLLIKSLACAGRHAKRASARRRACEKLRPPMLSWRRAGCPPPGALHNAFSLSLRWPAAAAHS